jgi:hypothetical protein
MVHERAKNGQGNKEAKYGQTGDNLLRPQPRQSKPAGASSTEGLGAGPGEDPTVGGCLKSHGC